MLVLDWSEVDYPIDSIDSAGNGFGVVEAADFLLAVVAVYVEELADSVEGELTVVLADDSYVMLH